MRAVVTARDLEKAIQAIATASASRGHAPATCVLEARGEVVELVATDDATGSELGRVELGARVEEPGSFVVDLLPLRELRIDDVLGPYDDDTTLETDGDGLIVRCRTEQRRITRTRSGEIQPVQAPPMVGDPYFWLKLPRRAEYAIALGLVALMVVVVVAVLVTAD